MPEAEHLHSGSQGGSWGRVWRLTRRNVNLLPKHPLPPVQSDPWQNSSIVVTNWLLALKSRKEQDTTVSFRVRSSMLNSIWNIGGVQFIIVVGMEYLLNGHSLLYFTNKRSHKCKETSQLHGKAFRRKSVLENNIIF